MSLEVRTPKMGSFWLRNVVFFPHLQVDLESSASTEARKFVEIAPFMRLRSPSLDDLRETEF